jgi:uncharacterized protein YbjT (DUF2867 family)
MTKLILVTGGTGTLGRRVVGRLREAAREVRVLTRRTRPAEDGVAFVTGDLATGVGLEQAVGGVGTIVHCASDRKGDAEATRNLVRAAATLPVAPHLVYVSIVGVDRLTFGYTRSKLDSERVVIESGLPWTILRATQFYDLILGGVRQLARLPVVPAPAGFEVRPVDAGDVAARLVELALGEPAGRVLDLAGPEQLSFADLLRGYLRARHRRRPVLEIWMPGLGRFRDGALLPEQGKPVAVGHGTWDEFLAERLAVNARSTS